MLDYLLGLPFHSFYLLALSRLLLHLELKTDNLKLHKRIEQVFCSTNNRTNGHDHFYSPHNRFSAH